MPVDSNRLEYSPYEGPGAEHARCVNVEEFKEYRLPEDQTIRPIKMEVYEARNVRGDTPARICLLGKNRTALRTFSFPEEGGLA